MDNRLQIIPLDSLIFDPQNPRLPRDLRGVTDEAKIMQHMLRDESLLELMKSIGESGYSLSEPLLVVPNTENKYIVVEGNRRLAALKLLINPDLALTRKKSVQDINDEKKHAPTEIPSIVYDSRESILDYLGYRHITGVKSWGALEKARYLKQLYDRHIAAADTTNIYVILAKMIGSRADYVAKLLSALNLYDYANDQAYYGLDIEEKNFDFSILSTAIGYENIYKYLGLQSSGDLENQHINDEHFKFVFERLYDPNKKIGESRELSELSAVLGNPDALRQYESGSSLSEALYYTTAPLETFKKFLSDAKRSLINAKNGIEKLVGDKTEIEYVISELRDIEKLAKTIRGGIEANTQDEDDIDLQAIIKEVLKKQQRG